MPKSDHPLRIEIYETVGKVFDEEDGNDKGTEGEGIEVGGIIKG